MNNELYSRVIVPASKSVEEMPVRVIVTEENNGFIVWGESHELGTVVLRVFRYHRDTAIEYAVLHAAADFLPMLKESGEAA